MKGENEKLNDWSVTIGGIAREMQELSKCESFRSSDTNRRVRSASACLYDAVGILLYLLVKE